MATTPTPGPSEPRHDDAVETQGDIKADTTTAPDHTGAAGSDGTPQNEPAEAEHDPASANGDGTPRADAPADAGSATDGRTGSGKVTPADLMAATKVGQGPGAGADKPRPGGNTAAASDQPADQTDARSADGKGTADEAGDRAAGDSSDVAGPAADTGTTQAGAATPADKDDKADRDEPPETVARDEWGRVDVNGEVYLRTAEGERHIGSWQVGEPEKALAFYRRKFDDLVLQVDLLEQRLSSGAASPDNAEQGIAKLRKALAEPHAIGDLDSLRARLEAVREQVSERRAERKVARAQELDDARARKERVAAEAEEISEGNDWRHGADRLRQLLDQWKSLPRLDRATDDALWRRFSTARTHYTRRRKAHFAELAERRESAREIKEEILAEAEELAESTDWGVTARRFRDLMSRWKSAGPAPRAVDEALWKRFRGAQDTFFEARSATFAQRDAEQQENLQAKEALLAEAEALLPVSDWKSARAALRSIQERWETIGHVPRESMKSVESRLRRVEDSIREAEHSDWQRTNPEARARAEGTVAQLQASISELEAAAANAREAGNERKASEAEEALAARRSWLEQAERALDDFR